MDTSSLIAFLALGTLIAVAVFALFGKAAAERRRHNPKAPKSSLAKDGPEGGVDLLKK